MENIEVIKTPGEVNRRICEMGAEIAAACGYNDYNYFITVFSRMVGMPPRQFQKHTSAAIQS